MTDNKSLSYGLIAVALVLAAILGAGLHYAVSPEKVIEKEVKVEVVKEVIKEVPGPTITVDKNQELLDAALDEYYAELDNDDDYLVCDGDEYAFREVSQKNDVKDSSVSVDKSNRRDTVTTVEFTIKNGFTDKSDDHVCYRTDEVVVEFHSNPNKDTEVSIN